MVIDFQQPIMVEGMLTFPEWAFTAQPLQPSQVMETEFITGSSTGTTVSITGAVGNLNDPMDSV